MASIMNISKCEGAKTTPIEGAKTTTPSLEGAKTTISKTPRSFKVCLPDGTHITDFYCMNVKFSEYKLSPYLKGALRYLDDYVYCCLSREDWLFQNGEKGIEYRMYKSLSSENFLCECILPHVGKVCAMGSSPQSAYENVILNMYNSCRTYDVSEKGQIQMMDLITDSINAGSAAFAVYKGSQTLGKIQNSVDSVTQKICDILSTLENNFVTKINSSVNLVKLITDILVGLGNIHLASDENKIRSVILNSVNIISSHFKFDFLAYIVSFYKYCYNGIQANIQMMDYLKYASNVLYNDNEELIKSFANMLVDNYAIFKTCSLAILSIFSLLFLKTLPGKDSIEHLFNRMGTIGKNISGVMSVFDVFSKSFEFVVEFFRVNVLKLNTKDELTKYLVGYETWLSEIADLCDRRENLRADDEILRDEATVLRIERLFKQSLEFAKAIDEKRLPSDLRLSFNVHSKFISEMFKKCDMTGVFGNKPRTQPAVIWLFGESGVGKSGMSWPLSIDLNAIFKDKHDAPDFAKDIYFRNVEQDFWDNYSGQNVVCYDDFGQMKDSPTTPNKEFIELIRTANIAPYPLHMASLAEKNKTKFTSRVIILTSNVFEQKIDSLTYASAFFRRIGLCGRVYVKDEYCKPGTNQDGQQVFRLDKNKVFEETGDVMSTIPYLIDLIDPESGITLEVGLDYNEFLKRAAKISKYELEKSTQMVSFLNNYGKDARDRVNKLMSEPNVPHKVESIPEQLETLQNQVHELNVNAPLFVPGQIQSDDFFISRLTVENALEFPFVSGQTVDPEKFNWNVFYNHQLKAPVYIQNLKVYQYSKEKFTTLIQTLMNTHDFLRVKIPEWSHHIYSYFNSLKDKCMKHINDLKTWCMENWIHKTIGIIGTIITILAATKLWSYCVNTYPNFFLSTLSIAKLSSIYCGASDRTRHVGFNVFASNKDDIAYWKRQASKNPNVIFNCVTEGFVSGDEQTSAAKRKIVLEVMNSGDSLTKNQQRKIILESFKSGDSVTAARKRVNLELGVSGDFQTKQVPRKIVEFSSGDVQTNSQKRKIIEGYNLVDPKMEMWTDTSANLLVSNRVLKSQYMMSMFKEDKPVGHINVLFVKGLVALTSNHVKFALDNCDRVVLRNCFNVKYEFPSKLISRHQIKNSLGENKEACLLVFEQASGLMYHPNIVKHFQDSVDMEKASRSKVMVPTVRLQQEKPLFVLHSAQECKTVDQSVVVADGDRSILIRKQLHYKANTTYGDCGSPIICDNNKVIRKIMGIHNVGTPTHCIGEALSRKNLEKALENLPIEIQIALDEDSLPHSKLLPILLPFDKETDAVIEFSGCIPCEKFYPGAACTEQSHQATSSVIRPSLIHGYVDPTTKPCYLRNIVVNGQTVNIAEKNLKKAAMDTPYIEKELVDIAVNDYKKVLFKNIRPELQRVFTPEEVIAGSPISEYLAPMNRRTSPGVPWLSDRKPGMIGKQQWLGKDDEYLYTDELREACEKRIELAKQGIRMPTIFNDTLKDERRPIEKVNEGKTRVFAAGPMDFTLVMRQYFLGFIAHVMENRIDNEQSLGTNPENSDWKRTADKLQSMGKKVIAGDFSSFDGTLNTCLLFKFVHLVNEFYDDGPENALIRLTLFLEVICSYHKLGDIFYHWSHSQPSGNPLTTCLNSFYNSTSMRVVFMLLQREWLKYVNIVMFKNKVSMVSYGDDNCINIADDIIEWFNQNTITEAYKIIGMIYTDEAKTGEIGPDFRSIDEIKYLKRNFIFDDETQMWKAPLDLGTILEIPNWIRDNGISPIDNTHENLCTAVRELSMHSEEVFNAYSQKLARCFTKMTGEYPDIFTYQEYNKERFDKYFDS